MQVGVVWLRFQRLTKSRDGLMRFTVVLQQQTQAVFSIRIIRVPPYAGLELVNRRSCLALCLENLREVIVSARVGGFQIDGRLQVPSRLGQRLPFVLQNAQMKMSFCEVRFEPERCREFIGGIFGIRFLHQHGSQFIMQLGSLRFERDGPAEFGDRPVKVFREIQRPSERAMGLRIVWRQMHGLL